MIHIIGCALILTMLVFGTFDATAEVLLQEDFEGELDLTTKWQTGHPKFVYPKDGILYLNQKKSGGEQMTGLGIGYTNYLIKVTSPIQV